jgi:hypothetical protein
MAESAAMIIKTPENLYSAGIYWQNQTRFIPGCSAFPDFSSR